MKKLIDRLRYLVLIRFGWSAYSGFSVELCGIHLDTFDGELFGLSIGEGELVISMLFYFEFVFRYQP